MKRLVRAAFPALIVLSLTLAPLAAQAAPTTSRVSSAANTVSMQKCELEIKAMLERKSSSARVDAFYNIASDRFKYVSARSLCGKNGKWLAFVDIYSQYNGGEPTGYMLQQAYVQYGNQTLPKNTENVTLKIGNTTDVITYSNQSVFNFKPKSLGASAYKDPVNISVVAGGSPISIYVSQQYPSKDVPTAKQAVLEMAPFYITHIKNDAIKPFDHTFLHLASYLQDSTAMERGYIWELYLVHGEKLPSKATVLRLDCDTRRVTISEREVRDYF